MSNLQAVIAIVAGPCIVGCAIIVVIVARQTFRDARWEGLPACIARTAAVVLLGIAATVMTALICVAATAVAAVAIAWASGTLSDIM